jgi:tetratricopeptide (TPR) repeat protein
MALFGFGYSKEKSRASAEKFLQQNKLQNAIAEYEKILKAEPNDLTILNQVGDIYTRLGQNDKAIERFRMVADSYMNDGATLKAIAIYKKITKLDPNALPTMEKLAELYRKQGLVNDARAMLLHTADAFTRRGQSKETLRILKQLVLFDPENVLVISRTADLMTQAGQKTEAKEMLSQTASTLVDRHALEPAQKILEKLVALDSGNLRALELQAQLTIEMGEHAKAAELYEAIPDLDSRPDALRNLLAALIELVRLDEAVVTGRKLATVHHDAEGMLRVAAALYKENETLRAIGIYQEFCADLLALDREGVMEHLHGAVSRVRTDPEALQSIYNLFQRGGEVSMIGEVLELLAHACVQTGQLERARTVYEQLIELEPDSAAHAQEYRQVCDRLAPGESQQLPTGEPKREAKPRTLEEFRTTDEPELPAQSYTSGVAEVIAAALNEAEMYDSMSSKARGIAILEKALQAAPDDLRLNRNLAALYVQDSDPGKAARCYFTMQRVLKAFGAEEAAEYYAKLASSGQTNTWETTASEFTAREFALEEETVGGTEEIDLSNEWETAWQNQAAEEPVREENAPVRPAAASEAASKIQEIVEEARFCLEQQIWGEAGSAIERLAQAFPEHPELPTLRARLQAGCAPPDAEEKASKTAESATPLQHTKDKRAETPRAASEAAEIKAAGDRLPPAPLQVISTTPAADEVSPTPAGVEAAAEVRPPSTTPSARNLPSPDPRPSLASLAAELDQALGEEEFVPSAPVQHKPAPPRSPEPQQAQLPRIPAVELDAIDPLPPSPLPLSIPAPATGAQPASQPAAQGVPYLAATAAEPQTSPTASVFGDLLEDFERDIAAPQESESDPETHFSLGMAFRDMGLLDEAIGELQKVCRTAGLSPQRAHQAYVWLATCFVEKSVPEVSIKWFLRALETAPDDEAHNAVNYELAHALEAAGRKREALERFLEVYGSNIDHRDVAERIRELRMEMAPAAK